jgi:hypothetical protein
MSTLLPPGQRHRPGQRVVRIAKRRRAALYVVAAGIWSTGALWLTLHYFFQRHAQFGTQANPAEPWALKLHGAFGFAALWVFGLLWGVHIVNGWTSGRRRWSGALLFGLIAVLGLTGYLLYYAGGDDLREAVSTLHWVVGLAAPALFVWHRNVSLRRAPRR